MWMKMWVSWESEWVKRRRANVKKWKYFLNLTILFSFFLGLNQNYIQSEKFEWIFERVEKKSLIMKSLQSWWQEIIKNDVEGGDGGGNGDGWLFSQ